jgi:hypothetical protein
MIFLIHKDELAAGNDTGDLLFHPEQEVYHYRTQQHMN